MPDITNDLDAEIALAAEAGYRQYWNARTDKAWEAAGPITRKVWFDVARAMRIAIHKAKEESKP